MSNPLSGLFQNGNNQFSGMLKQFEDFKRTFSGDPQQAVQQMLASGRISQEQYNQAVQMANQLQHMLK